MRLIRRPLLTIQVEAYDLPANWTTAAAPGTHRTGLGTMRPPVKSKRRKLPWQAPGDGVNGNTGP